jgi:integrase
VGIELLRCGFFVDDELMSKQGRRLWPGGYIHRQKDGRDLFILEKKVAKRRFHVSTRAHTLTAAMAQLERFESNPEDYTPRGDTADRLTLTAELAAEYSSWLENVKRTTPHHARNMLAKLKDWVVDLRGADLRKLRLVEDLKEPLKKRLSVQHRIIAIKAFCTWLRTEKGLLTTAEDRTLDLKVPQASPEKYRRRKVVSPEQIRAAWRKLPTQRTKDMLMLLSATGMHVSELERFVRGVDAELVRHGKTAAVVVRHKSGELARIPLTAKEHIEAAERLRSGGEVARRFNKRLAEACRKAGVDVFTAGVMRHSVATFAVQQGAAPAAVAAFLHHKDPRTTTKFYVDLGLPVQQVPVPRLQRAR